MRPSSLSVLILLAIATTPLLAQRPAPPTPGSRPASGTPGSAPSGAAPFARPPAGSPQSRASNLPGGGGDPNADSSLRRVVRERAGVTPPEHPPGASPPPPPVPPAGGPLPLPVPKPPVRPVTPSVAEDFLASLAGRAARAKTLNFAFDVRFLAADGSSSAVEIRGLSSRPGALLHRQRLSFSDGKVLTDVMLIHEVAGERPLAWHRGKAGEVLAYAGDPFAAAPGDAPGFQLLDVLFFDPAHYNLEVRGESELEGQPTMVVSGRPRFGRVEQLEFSFHRYRGNLLRTTATDAAGTLLFEARDEEFRESGGLLAGARRRIVRPGDGAMLVVHRKQWDVDPKLDGTLLEPATFLR